MVSMLFTLFHVFTSNKKNNLSSLFVYYQSLLVNRLAETTLLGVLISQRCYDMTQKLNKFTSKSKNNGQRAMVFFHPLTFIWKCWIFPELFSFIFIEFLLLDAKTAWDQLRIVCLCCYAFYLNRKSSRNDQFQLNLGKLHRKIFSFFCVWFTCLYNTVQCSIHIDKVCEENIVKLRDLDKICGKWLRKFFFLYFFCGVDHVCGVRIVLHRESEQVIKCLCLFELVDFRTT